MEQNKEKSLGIVTLVIFSCILMAIVETVIGPIYVIKSLLKIVFFFFIPLVFIKRLKTQALRNAFYLDKKSVGKLLILGISIYSIIIVAYFLTKGLFDYKSLVNSLSTDQQVAPESFIWVAAYISFGNSFLEEFIFRLFSFLLLSEYTSKKFAYIFSASMFAIYHVAMIGTSFPLHLIILSIVGLFIGGIIFNYVDDKNKTIYNSWLIHMFADFAIMTIWYLNI